MAIWGERVGSFFYGSCQGGFVFFVGVGLFDVEEELIRCAFWLGSPYLSA